MSYHFYLCSALETSEFSLLSIIFGSILVIILLLASKKEFSLLICIGFVLRLTVMFLDYYKAVSIPHSGADSEMFNYLAVTNVNNNYPFYLTNYTYFLTKLYALTDSSRLFAQFINVLFSLGVLLLFRRILFMLQIKKKIIYQALIILVFLPQLLFLSGILLRESWIIFFTTLSLYYFTKWYKFNNKISIVFCYLSVFAAMWMHEGLIGLLAGYSVGFFLYNRKLKKLSINPLSIFFMATILLTIGVGVFASGLMGEKIDKIDSEEFISITSSSSDAGSAYLQWIQSSSITMSLAFAPIKMFYFQFSPIPFDWRSLMDVLAFLFDSLVYILLFYYIVKYRKIDKLNQPLRNCLIVSILFIIFVFSYGTFASGTAIRHRAKYVPLVLIVFAITANNHKSKKSKNTYEITE